MTLVGNVELSNMAAALGQTLEGPTAKIRSWTGSLDQRELYQAFLAESNLHPEF